MGRYDRNHSRYDRGWRREPYSAWYPGAYWAGAPVFGWGLGWAWQGYGPARMARYADEYRPPLPPRRSPTWGRGADAAARRYARSHAYDEGYEIPPRDPGWGRGRG